MTKLTKIIPVLFLLLHVSVGWTRLTNVIGKDSSEVTPLAIDEQTDLDAAFFNSLKQNFVEYRDAIMNRGYNDKDYATIGAAVTAASADTALLVVSSRHNITSNTTISGETALFVNPNGRLSGSGTDSVFIKVPFDAGSYQVFDSTLVVIFDNKAVRTVKPEWWGGNPNDAISDSIAIYRSLQSLGDGGVVELAAGDSAYQIDGPILMPPGVVLRGQNVNKDITGTSDPHEVGSVIKQTSDNTDGILFGDGTTGTYRSGLENLTVIGPSSANTSNGSAIVFNGVSGTHSKENWLRDVSILNYGDVGIDIVAWSFILRFDNVKISSCDTNFVVRAQGNNIIWNGGMLVNADSTADYLTGRSAGIVFHGTEIESNGTSGGGHTHGAGIIENFTSDDSHLSVSNCYFEGNIGIGIDQQSNVGYISVTSSYFAQSHADGDYAISLKSTRGGYIAGNRFTATGGSQGYIELKSGAIATISGNNYWSPSIPPIDDKGASFINSFQTDFWGIGSTGSRGVAIGKAFPDSIYELDVVGDVRITGVPKLDFENDDGKNFHFTVFSDTLVAVHGSDTSRVVPSR